MFFFNYNNKNMTLFVIFVRNKQIFGFFHFYIIVNSKYAFIYSKIATSLLLKVVISVNIISS